MWFGQILLPSCINKSSEKKNFGCFRCRWWRLNDIPLSCTKGLVIIAIIFVASYSFCCLVTITTAKIYRYNYNHLHTCNNYGYKRKVYKILFLFPLRSLLVLSINRIFLIFLKNERVLFKIFAIFKPNTITQVKTISIIITSTVVI